MKLPSREHALEYGLFAGCIVVGLLILSLYPETWRLSSAVHSLGDALAVAGILGLTIETFVADLLVKRTATELSERLIGYGLPPDAQDVISSIVTATRVYRDYRKSFSIEHAENGRVKVRIAVSYTVVNNGKVADSYKPGFAEEAVHEPHFESLTYGSHHVADATWDRDERTGVVRFQPRDKVTILPSKAADSLETLGRERRCDVKWRYSLTMPSNYNDVTSFGGITVRPAIELLSIPQDLEFEAADDPVENKCDHVKGSSVWRFNRAFVKAQHFRVWWRPKI